MVGTPPVHIKKNLTGVANANNLHAQPAAAACRNKRMFYVYIVAACLVASDSRNGGGAACLVLQMGKDWTSAGGRAGGRVGVNG